MDDQGFKSEERGGSEPSQDLAQAIEEARRAFHHAAEKAGIAARAVGREVRSETAVAIEELQEAARTASERLRAMTADTIHTAHDGHSRPGPGGESSAAEGQTLLAPHLAGALAYLGWAMSGLIVYFLYEPGDRFVRFHAVQSILLTAALALVGAVVLLVPLVGKGLFAMAAIGFILAWLLAMWKAFKHETYPLPFIGELARSQLDRQP